MEKQILKLQHISKRFGAVQALKDVTFSVKQGEIHTLLGENGAGKSTIIKMLSGEYQPDEGKIVIEDVYKRQVQSRSSDCVLEKNTKLLFLDAHLKR